MFDAKVVLRPDGGGSPIASDMPVLVYLKDFSIDTTQFKSADLSKNREGIVTLQIAGQTTSFPYNGKGRPLKLDDKYLNKVVYLGGNPGCLDISISLIESDAIARHFLTNAAKLTEMLSKAPFLTAIHPAAGPGIGLLSSIMKFASTKIDDDCEAQVFCIHEGPLLQDRQITVLFARSEGKPPLLNVVFKVVGLNKMKNEPKRLRVRVNNPKFAFCQTIPSVCEQQEESSGVTTLTSEDKPIADWLAEKRMPDSLCFEASSGKSTYSYKIASGDVKPAAGNGIIAWSQNEVFTVNVDADAGNKKLLPLSLAFSLNTKDIDKEGILDLLKQTTALASVLMPEADKASQVLMKQAPTVLNFLSEITSENLSLYSFNGLVVLSDEDVTLQGAKGRGVLFAKEVRDAGQVQNKWIANVANKITWDNKEIGKFSFDLELVSG